MWLSFRAALCLVRKYCSSAVITEERCVGYLDNELPFEVECGRKDYGESNAICTAAFRQSIWYRIPSCV